MLRITLPENYFQPKPTSLEREFQAMRTELNMMFEEIKLLMEQIKVQRGITQKPSLLEVVTNSIKSEETLKAVLNSSPVLSRLEVVPAEGPFIMESVSFPINSKGQSPFRLIQWGYKTLKAMTPVTEMDTTRTTASEIAEATLTYMGRTMSCLSDVIGNQVYASGGNFDWNGLESIISDNNTYGSEVDADGNVKVIDRTLEENAYWRANVDTKPCKLRVGQGPNSMWAMYEACSQRDEEGKVISEPDLIVTTPKLLAAYSATLSENLKSSSNNLPFRNATVVVDKNCPEGCMYFLTIKYLKIRAAVSTHKTLGVMSTRHPEYLADCIQAWWMGNLVCTNPKAFGKLTNRTA